MHAAVAKGDIKAVDKLLELGLNLEEIPSDVLISAVDATYDTQVAIGRIEIVKRLIGLGMRTRGQNFNESETLLCLAMQKGNVEMTKALLHLGEEMDWRCAMDCSPEIVREVDVSKIHDHILFSAVIGRNRDKIRELARKGVDMNMSKNEEKPHIKFKYGDKTAFWLAVRKGYVGVIETLVEGADINARSSIKERTALHWMLILKKKCES